MSHSFDRDDQALAEVSDAGRASDYRSWHMNQGAEYDECINRSPLDLYMAQRERELIPRVVSRIFPSGIPAYLDFACGTGRITSLLAPCADVSVGVDISEKMLAQARPRCPGTAFVVVDVTKSRPDLGPFDLITGFRFLGNAQHTLRLEALQALRGLMKRDGYLLMNNHRNPWSIQSLVLRAQGLSDSGVDLNYMKLRRLYATAGFRIVRTYATGAWILTGRLAQSSALNSRAARWLETVTGLRALSPISVDYLILARKLGD